MAGMTGAMGGMAPQSIEELLKRLMQQNGAPTQPLGPTPAASPMQSGASTAPSLDEMLLAYLQSQRSNPHADIMYGVNPDMMNPKMSPTGATVDERFALDPNYRGFQQARAAGLGIGRSLKELPYDMKRATSTGKGIAQTGAGAAIGALISKDAGGAILGAAGSALGQAIIPIPGVGALVGGAAGGMLSKLFGGGDDEEEARKKAEHQQKLGNLRGNLERIASMYRR